MRISPFWLDFLFSICGWSMVFLFYLFALELDAVIFIVIEVLSVDEEFCFIAFSAFLPKFIDAVESLELSKYFLLWEISTLENFL